MTKFWIPIDEMNVCIQRVKRGKTVYFRFCPITMFKPTPKQQMVRMTLAKGAYNAFGSTEREVLASVQESFRTWVRTKPGYKDNVFKLLSNYFSGDAIEVLEFLQQYS